MAGISTQFHKVFYMGLARWLDIQLLCLEGTNGHKFQPNGGINEVSKCPTFFLFFFFSLSSRSEEKSILMFECGTYPGEGKQEWEVDGRRAGGKEKGWEEEREGRWKGEQE